MSLYDKAKQTADFIKSKINNIPKQQLFSEADSDLLQKRLKKRLSLTIKISLISQYLPYPVTQES